MPEIDRFVAALLTISFSENIMRRNYKGETRVKRQYAAVAAAFVFCLSAFAGCKEHHEMHYIEGSAPTCTEAGTEGYWECSLCGGRFSDRAGEHPADAVVLPAPGHNWASERRAESCEEDGCLTMICLRCGLETEEILPATGHLFGSWELSETPTCISPGEEMRTCAYCGKAETREVEMSEHAFSKDNVCSVCKFEAVSTEGIVCSPCEGGAAVSFTGTAREEVVIAPYHDGEPVVAIAENAFYGNETLSALSCYAHVRLIGKSAFHGCFRLSSVDLPDSVEEVGETAYYACSGAASLAVGSGVERIAPNAFYRMEALERITVSEENLSYSGEGNCLVERETGKLILGCGESVIPDGVREIGDNAFLGNRLIRSLVLPASIERIGDAAFFECGALVSVTYLGTREQWEAVEKGARWKDYAAFDEVIIAG